VGDRLASLVGIVALFAIAWAGSDDRARIRWRIPIVGTLLQLWLALFIVQTPLVPWLVGFASAAGIALLALDTMRPAEGVAAPVARTFGLLAIAVLAVLEATRRSGALAAVWGLYFLLLVTGRPRRSLVNLGAFIGYVAICAMLFLGELPRDFVFRGLTGIGAAVSWVIGFAGAAADQIFGTLRRDGGFVFAIEVGSIILVFSALMSLLYHVGILPRVVAILAKAMRRTMGVSGAEALAASANIFVGQTEAPLVIRPYLPRMTRSEVMALMTGGFATIAGSVMGAYIGFFDHVGFSRGAADLIAASVMSAPASLVFAKILVPESGTPETLGGADLRHEPLGSSLLDTLVEGVGAGLRLAVNVIAMLLVFHALIAMLNAGVNFGANVLFPGSEVTAQTLYARLFSPVAWLLGVPWKDCLAVGELLGTRTIFNEFLAYERLAGMIRAGEIGARSAVLSVYALCGFCNFMSIGIQIGGLSGLAPGQRPLFVRVALRAMLAGTLACHLTAALVGVVGSF